MTDSRVHSIRPAPAGPLHRLGPAILGASMFACADVLSKVSLNAGADVLTTSTFRSYIGVILLFVWLRLGAPASIQLRMLMNLGIDTVVGAIPLIGDVLR